MMRRVWPLILMMGCDEPSHPAPTSHAEDCTELRWTEEGGRQCEVGRGAPLTLYVEAATLPAGVRCGMMAHAASWSQWVGEVPGNASPTLLKFDLDVPPEVSDLSLTTRCGEGLTRETFSQHAKKHDYLQGITIISPFDGSQLEGDEARCWQGYRSNTTEEEVVQACQRASHLPTLSIRDRSRMLTLTGLLYRNQQVYDKSNDMLSQAEQLAARGGEQKRARIAAHNLADVRMGAGQLPLALEGVQNALDRAQRVGDRAGQVGLLRKKGEIQQRLGDLVGADLALRQAANSAQWWGDAGGAATCRLSLAILLGQLGDSSAALAALEEAIPYFDQVEAAGGAQDPGKWEELGTRYGIEAWLRLRRWQQNPHLDTASAIYLEAFVPALGYLRRLGPGRGDVSDYVLLLGELHHLAGDLPETAAALEDALPPDMRQNSAPWLALQGEYLLSLQQYRAAELIFTRLGQLELDDPDGKWNALFGRARALAGQGQKEMSQRQMDAALAALDEAAAGLDPWFQRGFFRRDRSALFTWQEALALESGAVDQAWEWAERRRMGENDRGISPGSLHHVASTYPQQWENFRRQVISAQQATQASPGDTLLPTPELRQRQLDRQHAEGRLRQVRGEFGRWVERILPTPLPPLPTLAQVQAGLLPGEKMLSFSPSPSGITSYWLDRDQLQSTSIPLPMATLEEWSHQFQGALLRSDGSNQAGLNLADALLPPAELQGVVRLVVIAGGPSLPFQALPWQGAPLLAQTEVLYTSTIGEFLSRRHRETQHHSPHPSPGQGLLVADPRLDLTLTRTEIQQIAAYMPQATLLMGEEVTTKRVVALLPGRRFFHFAGHGVVRQGGGPRLLLAGEEVLTSWELASHPLQLEWAWLSGCTTAVGTDGLGDHMSLTRSLLSAGAHSVIGSRWPIQQGDGLRVAGPLYHRRWQPGETLSSALHRVLREHMMSQPPRVWAGLDLWGGIGAPAKE